MTCPVPFRKNLLDIQPYVPGKPIEELERELGIKQISKLASNENPLGPSPKVLSAIEKALPNVNRYPDSGAYLLIRSLSAHLGVGTNQVILGHGSNELLVLLGQMVLKPGDEVLFAENSFVVYSLVAQILEAVPRTVPLQNLTHDLKAFAAALTSKTRLVFICNPNNPTGTFVPLLAIEAFLKICPKDILVVVDEAYYEYVEEKNYFDSLNLLSSYPNLVVLRTFSKAFGLAGLRVGYGVAQPELVEVFQKTRQPFNVNGLALVGAEAALDDIPHMKKVVELNRSMRQKLDAGLTRMGLKPAKSQTNFVYFETPQASRIYSELLKKGMIIRPLGASALRVSTGTDKETEIFLSLIEEVLMTSGTR